MNGFTLDMIWNEISSHAIKPLKRIEIFHEMVNLVPHIKNIVATPRFMLIHSDNQIISACQHTGIQIAQISRSVFKTAPLYGMTSVIAWKLKKTP